MNNDQKYWRSWAEALHQWGIADWVATILDSAGPLSTIAAQLVYISQPLIANSRTDEQFETLAAMLEDDDQLKQFVILVREETQT